jgi:hypothetical protein
MRSADRNIYTSAKRSVVYRKLVADRLPLSESKQAPSGDGADCCGCGGFRQGASNLGSFARAVTRGIGLLVDEP